MKAHAARVRSFILLCSLAGLSFAADPREAEILEKEKAFASAWNKRDAEAMAKLVTVDFLQVSRIARSRDRGRFLEDLKAGRYSSDGPNAAFVKPADFRVRFYGTNTAVVTFSEEAPWGPRDGKQVPTLHQSTRVWVNVDGKVWKMANMHTSLPPTPPQQK